MTVSTAPVSPTEELAAPPRAHPTGGAPVPGVPGRYLVVEQGAEPAAFALTADVVHIGRGFASQIHLEDPWVSRRHAILVRRPGAHRILDDRSHNGTFVNGTRVSECELRDGDLVRVGNVVLRYLDVAAA